MYLAGTRGRLATVAEIASTYNISLNHLTKVAHELGLAGYIVGVRGHGGGIRLAKPAEAITVGEIVRKIEADTTLLDCIRPGNTSCPLIQACVLRQSVMMASAAFFQVLDRYTFGDLIEQGAQLVQGF